MGLLPQAFNTYLIRNILIYPPWSSWSISLRFGDISNREYTHISSLELMVYFLELSTHIQWGIYSYILFGTPGLLPQTFEAYLIRNVLMYLLWSSWSTSQAFNTYLIRNILIYPRWRTHHIEEHSPNMYRDNPNREIHELRLWHWRDEDTTSRVSSRENFPHQVHQELIRICWELQ